MATSEEALDTARILDHAYRQSVEASVQDVTKLLQGRLSRKLTAYIAGVKDAKSVTRWANGEVVGMRLESEKRLRAAYEIAQLLTQYDSPQTVRAWFIGMNPQLNDISPAEAIHEGRLKEALSAARAYVADG
ncbi:MAG: XRE family transcriptional regulator [Chloroflexia bacterium]